MKLSYLVIIVFSVAVVKLLVLDSRILFQLLQQQQQHEHADRPCLVPINNNHEPSASLRSTLKSNNFVWHNQQARTFDSMMSNKDDKENDPAVVSPCSEQLYEIFQRHDCLLQTMNGGRFPGEDKISKTNQCHSNTTTTMSMSYSAPLYHLSYMFGQGFGRILQHGVKTCLLAALLHRPCVIDLIRDPYQNLRSYIQAGPYNWDQAARAVVHSPHAVNIRHAFQQMPQGMEKGHGWETTHRQEQQQNEMNNITITIPEYSDVLPMIWGNEKSSPEAVQRHLDLWDGCPDASNNSHKILLSPNFGDAWYAYGKEYISVHKEWNRQQQQQQRSTRSGAYCDANHMTTLLQDLMFTPTSLAYELYRERRTIVLQEDELIEEQQQQRIHNGNAKRILKQHPTAASISLLKQLPLYGAIHLRMNILNRDVYKMGVSKEQVVEGLRNCFVTLTAENNNTNKSSKSNSSGSNNIPDKWWLIADDVQVANFVTKALPNVYSYASVVMSTHEQATKTDEVGNGNNNNITTSTTNAHHADMIQQVKGVHSGNAMNHKFGQADLAASVLDWMVLHESHIALITHDSAYGETGARGSGKIRSTSSCGGLLQNKRRSFPMFSVFQKEE